MLSCSEKIYSNDYADILTDYLHTGEGQSDPLLDYCYAKIDDLLGIVYTSRSRVPELAVTTYNYKAIPKLYGLMQNISFPLLKSGILQIQQAPLLLTGKGVIIGIADTGIDYTQEAFRREDGTTRIIAIWDQTIPLQNAEFLGSDISRINRWNSDQIPKMTSAEVPFGTVYTREDINAALAADSPLTLVPTTDELGHGTAMACAAGGRTRDMIYGGAYDAEYVIVKVKEAKQYLRDYYLIADDAHAYGETDLMLAYRFIDSYSIVSSRPVVFCMGLGTNMGTHDGTALFAEYLNNLSAKRSRAVVVCAGNEGNSMGHYEGIGNQSMEIRVGEGEKGFILEIWGTVPYVFAVGIMTPGGESIPVQTATWGTKRVFRFVYETAVIEMERVLVEKSSGKELVYIRFIGPSPGIWRIDVRDAGAFHAWLPIREFLTSETYFLEPSPNKTITVPGYARAAITVSGYRDEDNSFYSESGRGGGTGSDIKPDIAAPAVNIPVSMGRQIQRSIGSSDDLSQQLQIGTMDTVEYVTGTSYAAAITSGAVAQFFEWAVIRGNDISVKSREIKSYLQRGAAREDDMIYPNEQWGYGRLDMVGTFDSLVGV